MRVSVIGGETASRGLLGVTGDRRRTYALAGVGAGAAVTMALVDATVGLVGGVLAALVVLFVTMSTPAGSPVDRWRAKRRWKRRVASHTHLFVPLHLVGEQAYLDALAGPKAQRAARAHPIRELPDGVDGLRWLRSTPRTAGIAWHAPMAEDGYLTVAWSVAGQVAGIESDLSLDLCSQAWGERVLARFGSGLSLPSRVQTLTRVLPADSARHERWVLQNLDRDAPAVLARSYDQLVGELARGSMVQRHFVVVRWPLGAEFTAQARMLGEGTDGWVRLMDREIESVTRALRAARMRQVQPMSAVQVAALVRNQQSPAWPIDLLAGVTPDTCWLPSEDEWAATKVTSAAPGVDASSYTGEPVTWWHRTAVIPVDAMQVGERTSLWLAPLLSRLDASVVRSISLQVDLIPASRARAQVRNDVTTDMGNVERARRKGQLSDGDAQVALQSARRRLMDLESGQGHHGAAWAGHLTLSARTREELASACAVVAEAAHTAGIERLDWCDTVQSGAQACTWPFTRGMRPQRGTLADAVQVTAGRGRREGL